MRERLLAMKQELERLADASEEAAAVVELDQARVGRLSRMDALQGQAMSVASKQRRALQLKKIDAALQRMEAGEYGLCLTCDEPINERRLQVDPTATLCIDCAAEAETV